jgi:hypothetical protein
MRRHAMQRDPVVREPFFLFRYQHREPWNPCPGLEGFIYCGRIGKPKIPLAFFLLVLQSGICRIASAPALPRSNGSCNTPTIFCTAKSWISLRYQLDQRSPETPEQLHRHRTGKTTDLLCGNRICLAASCFLLLHRPQCLTAMHDPHNGGGYPIHQLCQDYDCPQPIKMGNDLCSGVFFYSVVFT